MKECVRGSLMAFMDEQGGILSEETCLKHLAKPVLYILSKLHREGIIHRNIKPEHILFDKNYEARLCDFSVAGIVGEDSFTDREGTLSYMAPEMAKKPTPEEVFHLVVSRGIDESELPKYDAKVDIWSLGVVIVEALSGSIPFLSDTAEGMIETHSKHFSGEQYSIALRQLETSEEISDDCLDFLSRIFVEDPSDRADAEELLDHPWIKSI